MKATTLHNLAECLKLFMPHAVAQVNKFSSTVFTEEDFNGVQFVDDLLCFQFLQIKDGGKTVKGDYTYFTFEEVERLTYDPNSAHTTKLYPTRHDTLLSDPKNKKEIMRYTHTSNRGTEYHTTFKVGDMVRIVGRQYHNFDEMFERHNIPSTTENYVHNAEHKLWYIDAIDYDEGLESNLLILKSGKDKIIVDEISAERLVVDPLGEKRYRYFDKESNTAFLSKFQEGDIGVVTNLDKHYPSYEDMFMRLGFRLTKYNSTKNAEGKEWRVFGVGYNNFDGRVLLALENTKNEGEQILLGESAFVKTK